MSAPQADAGAGTVPLPEDLLSAVFSKLDVAERARASRVCRRWRAAALQPPYSAELELRVLLSGDSSDSELLEAARLALAEQGETGPGLRLALLEEAIALLCGPLCRGLLRLRLGLPPEASAPSSASAVEAVGAALPPTLLSLSVAEFGAREGWALRFSPLEWRAVLQSLDLARTAPRLEELEVGVLASLGQLELRHPTLMRLGAGVQQARPIGPALAGLPRLAVLGRLEVDLRSRLCDSLLGALADAGVGVERLALSGGALAEGHARLLRAGSALRLTRCTLPAGEGWSLPAGLAEVRLEHCALSPARLRSLLDGLDKCAPGLARLVLGTDTLRTPNAGGAQCGPDDVLAALGRLRGGTQLEVHWPSEDRWRAPGTVESLARTLASSPVLHRHAHIFIPRPLLSALRPPFADEFAAYRCARAAALRGMGEAGRRLLAEQGYDREDG